METGNNKKPLPGKVEFTGERLFRNYLPEGRSLIVNCGNTVGDCFFVPRYCKIMLQAGKI